MNSFDSRELRTTLGAFTTGVTVVTTVDATGRRHGVTASSFSSVSLDPPLILWSQSLNSRSYPAFRDGERFVVDIMAHDQVHVSNQFAKAAEDKFAGIATSEGIGGMPIIEGSATHLECVKVAAWPGGDHVVNLGRVAMVFRKSAVLVLPDCDGRMHTMGTFCSVSRSGCSCNDGLAGRPTRTSYRRLRPPTVRGHLRRWPCTSASVETDSERPRNTPTDWLRSRT